MNNLDRTLIKNYLNAYLLTNFDVLPDTHKEELVRLVNVCDGPTYVVTTRWEDEEVGDIGSEISLITSKLSEARQYVTEQSKVEKGIYHSNDGWIVQDDSGTHFTIYKDIHNFVEIQVHYYH